MREEEAVEERSLSPVLTRSRNAPRRVNWRRERSPVWGSTKVPFRMSFCGTQAVSQMVRDTGRGK